MINLPVLENDLKETIIMFKVTTRLEMANLRNAFQGMQIILGVDRLDYVKGLPQKLHSFNKMLTEHTEWSGKVVMVQLCIPTRSPVEEYKTFRMEVEGLVGRIYGNHGTPSKRVETETDDFKEL